MEFLDGLSRRLGEVARQVEEKSSEWLEIGKLNLEMFREEEAVRKISRRMGERIYDAYTQGQPYGGSVDEDCREISEKRLKIALLKQKIEEIKRAEEAVRHEESSASEPGGSPESRNSSREGLCPHCSGGDGQERETPVCEGQ